MFIYSLLFCNLVVFKYTIHTAKFVFSRSGFERIFQFSLISKIDIWHQYFFSDGFYFVFHLITVIQNFLLAYKYSAHFCEVLLLFLVSLRFCILLRKVSCISKLPGF